MRNLLLPKVQIEGAIDEEKLTFGNLRQRVLDCVADFNNGRYEKVVADIPNLVISIEAAISLLEGEAKVAMLRLSAHAYILTAQTLIHLRCEDLATHAIRNAMDAAENAGDPVLCASAARNYTWAFTRQGMYGKAETIAVDMASEIEPSMSKGTPEQLAVWGLLHMEASDAAARDNRPERAKELLSFASMAAVRLEGTVIDYSKYWQALDPNLIGIKSADNALIDGDAELALHVGKEVRRSTNIHLDWWSWHLLVMADAYTSTRNYAAAIESMKSIRTLAPEWIKNHRDAHDVARKLLDATHIRRAKSSGLAELAKFMGVEP